MRIKVERSGDSIVIRIPKHVAAALQIAHGAEVDITLSDGGIMLVPPAVTPYTLEQLLAEVTECNLHDETNVSKPAGQEVW